MESVTCVGLSLACCDRSEERGGLEDYCRTLPDITSFDDQSGIVNEDVTSVCCCNVSSLRCVGVDEDRGRLAEEARKMCVTPSNALPSTLREECEVLFRCGADSPFLIAGFFSSKGWSLDKGTIRHWSRGKGQKPPIWCKAYGEGQTLVVEYHNFLNQQWVERPKRRKSIREERERLDATAAVPAACKSSLPQHREHPLRVECEILFKYGDARSAMLIATFFRTRGRRSVSLSYAAVEKWRNNQKSAAFCVAYEDKYQLISGYCRFLSQRLSNTKDVACYAKKHIKQERDRVIECLGNMGTTKGTKRTYAHAFPCFSCHRYKESFRASDEG